MYEEFLKLTGTDTKLVVIPTASSRTIDKEQMQELWLSRGFKDISILHTTDRDSASTNDFIGSLRTATAVWFIGGSQNRITDAYLGTVVEQELYKLIQRGGVVGESSAGATIQSSFMISGGHGDQPKITSGFELVSGAIIDEHL